MINSVVRFRYKTKPNRSEIDRITDFKLMSLMLLDQLSEREIERKRVVERSKGGRKKCWWKSFINLKTNSKHTQKMLFSSLSFDTNFVYSMADKW